MHRVHAQHPAFCDRPWRRACRPADRRAGSAARSTPSARRPACTSPARTRTRTALGSGRGRRRAGPGATAAPCGAGTSSTCETDAASTCHSPSTPSTTAVRPTVPTSIGSPGWATPSPGRCRARPAGAPHGVPRPPRPRAPGGPAVDPLGEVEQAALGVAARDSDLAGLEQHLEQVRRVAAVRPAARAPGDLRRVGNLRRMQRPALCQLCEHITAEPVVGHRQSRASRYGSPARMSGTKRATSDIGRQKPPHSKTTRSSSIARTRSAGWYGQPIRLHRIRSALRAMVAVGSRATATRSSTASTTPAGRRASSSCAPDRDPPRLRRREPQHLERAAHRAQALDPLRERRVRARTCGRSRSA